MRTILTNKHKHRQTNTETDKPNALNEFLQFRLKRVHACKLHQLFEIHAIGIERNFKVKDSSCFQCGEDETTEPISLYVGLYQNVG